MSAKPEIDVSKLTAEERNFFEKYGRLPPKKKDILNHRLMGERKYFDSGDYAMSKAGKSSPKEVGSQHPSPERIPHSVPSTEKKSNNASGAGTSPGKESALMQEQEIESDEEK
ncbi:hypothetical protein HK098_006371 [Nowakowskiella sp. JEL0407]|nr:hypothetical protein HK098_006371 [Nowakowskiella sp. JEL0407]